MQVQIHKGSVLRVPSTFTDVLCTKVFNDAGQLLAVVLEHGGGVLVTSAGEPEFKSFCEQYGIAMAPVQAVDFSSQG